MKIGNFEDTEDSSDIEESSLENPDDIEDAEEIEDADEVEDVGETNLPEGEEAEKDEETSAMDKVKEFFNSLFDRNDGGDEESEAGESDENAEALETSETSEDEKPEENSTRPSWELSPEEKADVLEKQSKVAEDMREKYNLDENGQKLDNGESASDGNEDPDAKTHGEDGERTLYSDLDAPDHEEDELEL